jgi:class I fructose-bisphosphate aldolase
MVIPETVEYQAGGAQMAVTSGSQIEQLLGDEAEALLTYEAHGIDKGQLHLPGPDFIDRVWMDSDRPVPVLRNLGQLFATGRLGGSGYLSILPVDQGIEHSAAASFAKNPAYFDPRNLVELAIESGCNAIATTFGVLGMEARRYAHRIPFIVKLNHNQLMTYPNEFDQIMFGSVRQAYELGAIGVGATVYFGSEQSSRQIIEVSEAFEEAHALGMFTVLTGQANHLGVTIQADIIKQKQPERNGGFLAFKGYGKTDPLVYDKLTTDNPIDMTRWQVVNTYMGRVPLINSGGESAGDSDLAQAVRTAVINKRAGGAGLIVGRKAFQRPLADGVALLNTVQDVYLDEAITPA